MNFDEIMEINNLAILKSFLKANFVLQRHRRIAVSISGGSDSDVILDLIQRVKGD